MRAPDRHATSMPAPEPRVTAAGHHNEAVLPDGVHEALVVDASPSTDGATELDLTIVAGDHKGEVVTIRAEGIAGDPLDLLGLPATITVREGSPSVVFD